MPSWVKTTTTTKWNIDHMNIYHIGSFHWNVSQKKVHCIVVFVVDDIRMTFFEAEEPLQFDLPRRLTKQAIRNAVLDWIPDLAITEFFLGSATL